MVGLEGLSIRLMGSLVALLGAGEDGEGWVTRLTNMPSGSPARWAWHTRSKERKVWGEAFWGSSRGKAAARSRSVRVGGVYAMSLAWLGGPKPPGFPSGG